MRGDQIGLELEHVEPPPNPLRKTRACYATVMKLISDEDWEEHFDWWAIILKACDQASSLREWHMLRMLRFNMHPECVSRHGYTASEIMLKHAADRMLRRAELRLMR